MRDDGRKNEVWNVKGRERMKYVVWLLSKDWNDVEYWIVMIEKKNEVVGDECGWILHEFEWWLKMISWYWVC